jgi:hypothetical protein
MGDRVELLLVRIDHFADRAAYVATLRSWLEELQVASGRVISMGSDLQLLFVAASEAQNAQLVEFFRSKPIDTNSRGERCVDRFVDVLGRKLVDTCSCRGFLEMHVLNAALLHKVLVLEWQAEHKWLDEALATKRTKAFLDWKDAAKAARKERRKREGLEKQHEREAKRAKREQEKKELEDEKVEEATEVAEVAVAKEIETVESPAQKPKPPQKNSKKKTKKRRKPAAANRVESS